MYLGIKIKIFDKNVINIREYDIPYACYKSVFVGINHALKSKFASVEYLDGFVEILVLERANIAPDENGFFGCNLSGLLNFESIYETVALTGKHAV